MLPLCVQQEAVDNVFDVLHMAETVQPMSLYMLTVCVQTLCYISLSCLLFILNPMFVVHVDDSINVVASRCSFEPSVY